VVLILASGIFELFGETARAWLQYDRAAIGDAELWRLLSGQLVHLGPGHYILNALGLMLVWLLVGANLTTSRWIVVTVVSMLGVGAGLWLFNPGLERYVGMSGFLHGILMGGVLLGLKTMPREAVLIAVVVGGKIAYEQLIGPMPGSEKSAGGPVVVDAHLYGALAGLGTAAVFWLQRPSKSPR
jgi:rhomboid family GlyGly-CTERM serine protease